jgi:hypothetical protein
VPPGILIQPERLLVVEPGGRTSVWVQAIGRGLQYQWCKRAEDDPSLSETTQQHIFQEHASEFKKCVNAANLCSFLFNAHLITAEQMEELMHDVVGNTNAKKVQRLLQWLPRSCTNFLEKLIRCLRETDHLGHLELAASLENDLWVPLSSIHCHYTGADTPTLMLCDVKETHEGEYRCRVTSSDGGSILSQPAHVSLVKPDDKAVQAFVTDLHASPENGAELAQTLISRLQKGSLVGYIALTEAVKRCGDCKEVVRAFIANGWPPDQPQQGGRTLVHVLAEEGCTESLMMVLGACSEQAVRAADETRHTPLHLAVRAGRLETVQAMLNRESCRKSIDYQDKKFNTALHLAVESGSADMVDALLTVRAINLGVLNETNETAMQVAVRRRYPRIISLLKERKSISSPMILLSPDSIGIGGAAFERRCNSCESILHRSESEVSRATSGYGSSCGGTMQRTESVQMLNAADRQMLELQRQLKNYKGTLTGKALLKKGDLKKCTRKGELKTCTLFVFSDVVLYTKYSDIVRKFHVSNELSVRGMEVLDSQDSEQPAVRNEPFSFTLTSREKAMHLVASSQEEKMDWIQCLKDCIAALHEAQGHQSRPTQLPTGAGLGARAPPWVPDTHVTACQLSSCGKKFSLFERKHHCRQCGKVVCGTCSPEKRYLNYLQKKERVCNECVKAFAGHKSVDRPQLVRTVISGYAMRLRHGVRGETMWYRLDEDNIIHIYGAHQDTKPSYQIVLKMGYSVHGDMGSRKIVLTHPTGREELNESFQVAAEDYLRWYQALKERTQ